MKRKMLSLGILVSSVLALSGCVPLKEELVNSQEIAIDDVEEISINYNSDNLNFYQSTSDKLVLEEYLIPNKGNTKAKIETAGKALSIEGGQRKNTWFVFNNDSRIDIYLPRNYQQKLAVQVTSGDITGKVLLKLKDFSAEASSGNLSFKQIDATNIHLAVTSGEIEAKQLYSAETNLQMSSGTIELGKVTSKKLIAEGTSGEISIDKFLGAAVLGVSSGNIELGEVQGSADLAVTSGEISADFNKVLGDVSAEATSGNLDLTISKDESFNFESQLGSGDVSTNFAEQLEKKEKMTTGSIGQDPRYLISTKVTSGSIEVEWK